MSYGVKYQTTFNPVSQDSADNLYTLNILEKDYSGDIIPVVGSGVPVLHQYQTDDPKAPIKGSSLAINLLNVNGALPLSSFFSVNDDQFQVQLFWNMQLMWIGYLVQDDFNEPLLDYTHEINLSANDNLGLLKDVALDKAKITYDIILNVNDTHETTAPHTLIVSSAFAAFVQNGDIIEVFTLIFNSTYTVVDNSGGTSLIVAETVSTVAVATDTMRLLRPSQFPDKVTLATVFNNCLAATDLQINTQVFCNFLEASMNNTISFIEQTLLDTQTFLKDATGYDNCYSILSQILDRLNCALFQAKGVWNIVHWDELRYFGYPIPGYAYDSDFNLIGPVKLNNKSLIFAGFNPFAIGDGENTIMQTAANHRVLRPFNFDKETFNYKQPAQLLRNFDLQTLGNLLKTSTSGSGVNLQTTREYAAPWWYNQLFFSEPTAVYFIRVISDYLDNELDRYLVVVNVAGTSAGSAMSYKIEANKGDGFKFSFRTRTSQSIVGGTLQAHIIINDGAQPFQSFTGGEQTGFPTTGDWQVTSNGWTLFLDSPDDTNIWHPVEVDATINRVPFDGLLYFYLDNNTTSAGAENQYNDIRLDYLPLVNQSTKIIGQTHTTSQDTVTKNNEDVEIYIDDSPRNSIAGTLFLNTMTGLIQNRTVIWYLNNALDTRKLGDLTTFETLFWRRKVRSIVEGTYYGLISADTLGDHISMLAACKVNGLGGVFLVFGRLEIDYKNNKCSGTLWEIWDHTEVDSDLTAAYEFKYLYAPK